MPLVGFVYILSPLSPTYILEDEEMLENKFKTQLCSKIKKMLPGCIIIHPNPNEHQGIPDIIVLYKNTWGALEGKKEAGASHRPNQDYYVRLMNAMSYSAFIFPENEKEILDELQQTLRSRGDARDPRSE